MVNTPLYMDTEDGYLFISRLTVDHNHVESSLTIGLVGRHRTGGNQSHTQVLIKSQHALILLSYD